MTQVAVTFVAIGAHLARVQPAVVLGRHSVQDCADLARQVGQDGHHDGDASDGPRNDGQVLRHGLQGGMKKKSPRYLLGD